MLAERPAAPILAADDNSEMSEAGKCFRAPVRAHHRFCESIVYADLMVQARLA